MYTLISNYQILLSKKSSATYIDDALFVADQQISEQASFTEVSQFDHIIHTFHRSGVHKPKVRHLLF